MRADQAARDVLPGHPLARHIDDFLTDLANANRPRNTIRAYRGDLIAFAAHHDGDITDITAAPVRAFLGAIAGQAPATRKRKRAAVSGSCPDPRHRPTRTPSAARARRPAGDRPVLRDRGRGRHAQGGPCRRPARPGHLPGRRGAGGPAGRAPDQDNSSQPAAGSRRPRGGGPDGAPAWSAAWTAAATSSAVSASMTMFRRSSTRRTTCPACRGASRGPMAAGEGPVASGSVTSGTVEEPAAAGLIDTPALQHLLQRSLGGAASGPRPAGDHVENPSIPDTTRLTPHRVCSAVPIPGGFEAGRPFTRRQSTRPGSSRTGAAAPLLHPGPA